MLEDLQEQIGGINRRLHEQAGAKACAERIAASMLGVADSVRNEGQNSGLDPADVKVRVALILKCREAANGAVGDAEKERALLQGEARALGRQIENIRRKYAAAVADEQRKARIEAEEREAERKREEKSKPKRKAPAKRKAAKSARTPAKSRRKAKGAE